MKKTCLVVLLIPLLAAVAQNAKPDIWKPFEYLEGVWEGRGEATSGISSVVQEYRFILGGNFIQATNRAEFKAQEKNPQGELHEDMEFISYDQGRKTHVLRGFYSEGFVNRYIGKIEDGGKSIIFETEAVENAPAGTRAKIVLRRTAPGKLEQSFYVAWPGREYSCMSTNYLTKRPSTKRP
jgi:hypothetical protein